MRKVIFSNNIKAITINDVPDNTLIVVHEMYDIPNIKGEVVQWQKFKNSYLDYNPDQFIIVGANRMITPSNRCDMVNDYIQIMTKSIPKISIDTAPFIGEPWRVWYHYSLAFGQWLGVDYSYPIEGEYMKWFYYEVNFSQLSPENLKLYISDMETNLAPLNWKYKLYEPNNMDLEYYEEVKSYVFDNYHTPKLLVNNLLKLCNKRYILDINYDTYKNSKESILPNLGIYRFIAEENKRRMNIYNLFTNGIKEKI